LSRKWPRIPRLAEIRLVGLEKSFKEKNDDRRKDGRCAMPLAHLALLAVKAFALVDYKKI